MFIKIPVGINFLAPGAMVTSVKLKRSDPADSALAFSGRFTAGSRFSVWITETEVCIISGVHMIHYIYPNGQRSSCENRLSVNRK
jgi:hypothetical protein